ncbi:YcfL family protein [Leeia sp. TBRC 13508]|uniref:YcfL family protein n=1 Tax=Leeia speluncae TaxID=2884804 RepID=A0ABS8D789_9NEIS|nr:DUF1425 domain-containing protein [Leeia speluncae]MCB6184060.1 YcfL family protein [Leeia speluncae]
MKFTKLVGLICFTLILSAPPVMAESIASKIEQLGKMDEVSVVGIKKVVRDGLVRLQIELSNADNEIQQFTWRIRWLDDSGFQVGSEEVWKPEVIYGKQKKVLSTVAPSPQATDFKVELYSPENYANGANEPSKN